MFEWDDGNETEVLKHDVTPSEVEETFEDARLLARDAYERDGEQRRALWPQTLSGRLLTVVYTHRGAAIRVVTAYPTRGRLRRLYLEGQ